MVENSAPNYKKPVTSVRQEGTVPFLWEEKPGTPKKDWKMETVSVNTVPTVVKLVSTIPFKWEEKPGKPLPIFTKSYAQRYSPSLMLPDSPDLPLPPAKFIGFSSASMYSLCSSPKKCGKLRNMFWRVFDYDNDDISEVEDEEENDDIQEEQEDGVPTEVDDDDNEEEGGGEEEEETFELDIEESDFNKNEPFKSAPSLLANCCKSEDKISKAVPVDQYLEEEKCHTQHGTPTSPTSETESYFSSYATGSSSRADSSFFECFFPQFSPESDYHDKAHGHKDNCSPTPPDPRESTHTMRTPTLGELIRVSYRGYMRSSLHSRRRNTSLDFMKGFGCCISGAVDETVHSRQHSQRQQMV
ncbi:hypothetical protein IFM89_032992 [Coptis chinensis]|uniref:Uncharacterized protein n=1 Tax=Coptis chinensis TaxID=261450 RepID=A0A835II89_9MAGN|nr:hypothetical protein IFM89_032992 [Coptis chinensis]